ncbi:iron dicitrate transport regulator FecR [Hylemonella gracilis str. Niagara R]|uniref:Iron dicitrate transport regulator FecR n=1 Tax=Hylemonella gracilis str. Niagara R TaxID=1458275 RepID=A0A016XF97_9BURK|nr:FecR domain-containing protein [Hylemonella gracilis]EYC49898.1 iron dicitrate transport regulator FecR [Hylemonella gracilis str. Niagara R]
MSAGFARAPGAAPPQDEIPPTVVDAAIDWALKLEFNRPTPAMLQAFEEWRQAHALHAHAWQRMQSLRQDFAAMPGGLARNALQVVEARRGAARAGRRQAFRLLMLAGVAVTGGWALRDSLGWQHLTADAATRVGEQRTLRLDDGTVLVLNTDSAVSFEMAAAHRRVVLRRGEIMVTTGPDPDFAVRRPFWVDTPFGAMQALGTRFVVRLEDGRARVSVQDGAVRMYPVRGGDGVTARVGESWWLNDRMVKVAEQSGLRQDAWVDGVIAGQNMRMADVLAELSRYRSGRIVCDEGVADLRVSGIYHVRDTDQALRFLAQTQPVRVTYHTRFWVVVEPASAH